MSSITFAANYRRYTPAMSDCLLRIGVKNTSGAVSKEKEGLSGGIGVGFSKQPR